VVLVRGGFHGGGLGGFHGGALTARCWRRRAAVAAVESALADRTSQVAF